MSNSIKWKKFSYTEEQLRLAVKENRSARASMLALGLNGTGAGYKPFMRLVKLLNLETDHWTSQGYLKGQTHSHNKTIPLANLLHEGIEFQSFKLKGKLLKAGLLKSVCAICSIDSWQGVKLSLQLDHINGTNTDNRLANLRLLCPNCHSQTPTFAGKNKGRV